MDVLPLTQASPVQDLLCATCEAIDWAEIIRLTHSASSSYVEVRQFLPRESKQALQLSGCRVCRALAAIICGPLNGNYILASSWVTMGKSHSPLVLYIQCKHTERPSNFLGSSHHSGFLVLVEPGFKSDTQRFGNPQFRDNEPIRFPSGLPDFEYIKNAEMICRSTHHACRGAMGPTLALRLRFIDCYTHQIVEAENHHEYVALSYVWGNTTTVMTPMAPGRKEAGFPAVVRDSIKVTLALNYRYLWVDRHVNNIFH